MWCKSCWLVVLVFLIGCVPKEQVELRAIDNVELAPGKGVNPILKADARFYNPNKIRMKIKAIELDVFIDGKKSARVDQKLKSVIKSQAEFTLPLEVQISMKEIGLVDALLGLFGGKKYLINYRGQIKVNVKGFPLRIPVDYSKEVRLRI